MKISPLGVALALLVLILTVCAAGTVYAFLNGFSFGYAKTGTVRETRSVVPGEAVFELGSFRGKTVDKAQKVFALRVALGYPENDPSFAEELDSRKRDLAAACRTLFESCFASQFDPGREDALKAGVLRTVNSLLVLGKATTVYIGDIQVF